MKKMFLTMAVTGVLLAATSITSYAAQWKSDAAGWWWEEDDGSYPVSAWREINGKWYYFGQDGYMLANTTTPDGYQVGEDGAWILDTSDELPITPYADKIAQYKGNNAGFQCDITFSIDDLQDYGAYYGLENQKIYQTVPISEDDYDYTLIYTGSIYFYKDAQWASASPVTFEEALSNEEDYPMWEGYYHWVLWSPDEKGYFTEFSPFPAG